MKEIELIGKRGKREKHFLQSDGSVIAKIYNEDIHYIENGKYKEIDNTLIQKGNHYENKNNSYKVKFPKSLDKSLFEIESDNNYIQIKLKDFNLLKPLPKIKKKSREIIYNNVLDNIDFEYKTLSNKVKETIILNKDSIKKLDFIITTNLDLSLEDKYIIAKKDNKIIFTIDAPFMKDSNEVINNNIDYTLFKHSNYYELGLN